MVAYNIFISIVLYTTLSFVVYKLELKNLEDEHVLFKISLLVAWGVITFSVILEAIKHLVSLA